MKKIMVIFLGCIVILLSSCSYSTEPFVRGPVSYSELRQGMSWSEVRALFEGFEEWPLFVGDLACFCDEDGNFIAVSWDNKKVDQIFNLGKRSLPSLEDFESLSSDMSLLEIFEEVGIPVGGGHQSGYIAYEYALEDGRSVSISFLSLHYSVTEEKVYDVPISEFGIESALLWGCIGGGAVVVIGGVVTAALIVRKKRRRAVDVEN